MKKICLVFSIIVAVLVLFAATRARANCDPGWCFQDPISGFKVEAVNPDGSPPNGTFPDLSTGDSVFTYKITSSGKSVSHVDILLPVCLPTQPPTQATCKSQPCAAEWKTDYTKGDPSTNFGFGLTTYGTYKVYYSGTSGIVSFTIPGKVYALPSAMLLKSGSSPTAYGYGQILSPSFSATCE